MILALLLSPALLSVPAAAQDQDVTVETRLSAPDSIAPAITPYIDCLVQAVGQGSQRAGPVHAEGMRKVVVAAKEECASVRKRARVRALRLIADDASIAHADRESTVDRVLTDVDHMPDAVVAQIDRMERAEAAGPKP